MARAENRRAGTPARRGRSAPLMEESGMNISVRLNPGHPTGTYRRAGFVFSANEPTILDAEKLERDQVEQLHKDAWLTITPVLRSMAG